MAECNFDYNACFETLTKIQHSRSWFYKMLNFGNRKVVLNHPMDSKLVFQVEKKKELVLTAGDEEMAQSLNQQEYSTTHSFMSCQCCFLDFTFEELGSCTQGHLFCGKCIEKCVMEATFGSSSLRYQEISCVEMSGCQGTFSHIYLKRFVAPALLSSYSRMLTERELQKARVELLACPFCFYAEEVPPTHELEWLQKTGKQWLLCLLETSVLNKQSLLSNVLLFFVFTSMSFFPHLFLLLVLYRICAKKVPNLGLYSRFIRSLKKSLKQNYILNCKNPGCLKPSCVHCKSVWEPLHVCHEKDQESFRLYIEKALSSALIRTASLFYIFLFANFFLKV